MTNELGVCLGWTTMLFHSFLFVLIGTLHKTVRMAEAFRKRAKKWGVRKNGFFAGVKKRNSRLNGKGNGVASKMHDQKENGGESEERQKGRRKTKNGDGKRTNIHIVSYVTLAHKEKEGTQHLVQR